MSHFLLDKLPSTRNAIASKNMCKFLLTPHKNWFVRSVSSLIRDALFAKSLPEMTNTTKSSIKMLKWNYEQKRILIESSRKKAFIIFRYLGKKRRFEDLIRILDLCSKHSSNLVIYLCQRRSDNLLLTFCISCNFCNIHWNHSFCLYEQKLELKAVQKWVVR